MNLQKLACIFLICSKLVEGISFKKNPKSIKDWPLSDARSTPVLVCRSRFYQGYRLKKGDSGEIVFNNGPNTDLCLWKFFPQNCRISFYCSEFSVSSGSSERTCPRKLITKIDKRNARRWCASQKPPKGT